MKTFVIGDIHGGFKALKQCLKKSKLDYKVDKLIVLGDVADGWPDIPECFEELFKIKHLVYIRGNHDQWLKDFLKYGKQPDVWTLQGGMATREAYLFRRPELMKPHLEFLKKTKFYYKDDKNRVFVHGGIDLDKPIEENTKRYLCWDRALWDERHRSDVKRKSIQQYKEIYVGHTSIYKLSHFPANYGNIWFMDTGGGWEGVLSIMNIDTKEFWQSDIVSELYPEIRGRN